MDITVGTPNEILNDKKVKEYVTDNYLGSVYIPVINLKQNLYPVNSDKNDVDKNIEILDSSSMPDVLGGNFILAGHNGNTNVGYFRRLHELSIGDKVIVNYGNTQYSYTISKIYDVLKTGKVSIYRDKSKSTITLITCLGTDKQLVVIGYLDT